MSGFSADWLALREPADHKARDGSLLPDLQRALGKREKVRVIDLGCGAGSNLRALAPSLPPRQDWQLIDYDPALLDAAKPRIESWPGRAELPELNVAYKAADLQSELEQVITTDCDLVTAAALFDLVSKDWIDRFVGLVAKHKCLFYTVLIYDGQMRWHPTHPADDKIGKAFNLHQTQDKGFGPSAGPEAAQLLADGFRAAGYTVTTGNSPWQLGTADKPLIQATAEGVAQAARETGRVPDEEITSWLDSRAHLEKAEIGHIDILALP